MARLDYPDYLRHLRGESRRFRDVLAGCASDARVPGCPEWTAGDLLWHLAEVQWFWGTIIRTRPLGPDAAAEEPERPKSYDGLLEAFDTYSAALIGALEEADPAEQAWSWSTEQTVGFTFRRQAHEALIHRVDAELATGTTSDIDPALAGDGIDEVLRVMHGSRPSWAAFERGGGLVRIETTDTGDSWTVALGRVTGTDPESGKAHDEPSVVVLDDDAAQPDATVRGSAADLDCWLWGRLAAEHVERTGDEQVLARLQSVVDVGID
jgi:uncharacterized protein (TIGR03083 family)